MTNIRKPKLEALDGVDEQLAGVQQTIEQRAIESPPMDKLPNDPFDLVNLRLDQNFAETVGVKKLLKTMAVRKPGRQDFIRVHPDPNYRDNLAIINYEIDHEVYIVTPIVARE